jgi:ATP-binding cassette subfamily B protein
MFDNGIDLSGGQWQKLALARAFYRDAPILILDEPTSAIDAKAEYEIFEKVQNLQKDKTVIIISHRFSTVRNADRILVLNEGKIIEEGNHKQLMKLKGVYEELFSLQAQGYK